jgi:hypothetical protein
MSSEMTPALFVGVFVFIEMLYPAMGIHPNNVGLRGISMPRCS